MSDKMREHVCPNCGAPLGIPDRHERFFKCQFCGTVLEDHASSEEQQTGVFKIKISREDISAAQMARIPVYTAPPVVTSFTPMPAANVNRVGCIITGGIIALVGIILAVALIPTLLAAGTLANVAEEVGLPGIDSGLGGLRIYSYGPYAYLPSDDDTSPDFIALANASDDNKYLVYVDFESEPALRWKTEIAGEQADWVYNVFLSDQTRIYFSYGDKLAAYNREQGALAWQATIADEIQHNICPGCFQLFGDTVMTMGADGTLQAWDAATGQSLWQVRMTETPRQIVNFGGNPAVLDDIEGWIGLKVFNLATGSLVEQFTPACPNDSFPDSPQEIGIYDYIVPAQDGSVLFMGGFFQPNCVMRWYPGQAQAGWVTTSSTADVSATEPRNLLLTGDTLFIAHSEGAYAINLADGALRVLTESEDYDFRPLAARDGVLVLLANRTRGSSRTEIWGIDAQLGNVKWTFIPQAAQYFDSESTPLNEDGYWIIGLTESGVTVAQLYDEPARVVFQTIPLQSGTASSPATFNFTNDIGGHWTSVLGWRTNTFWAVVDAVVYEIDITTADAIHSWP